MHAVGTAHVVTGLEGARSFGAVRDSAMTPAARTAMATTAPDPARQVRSGPIPRCPGHVWAFLDRCPCGRRSRRSRWSARSEARTNDLEVRRDDGHTRPRRSPGAKVRGEATDPRRPPHAPRRRSAELLMTQPRSFRDDTKRRGPRPPGHGSPAHPPPTGHRGLGRRRHRRRLRPARHPRGSARHVLTCPGRSPQRAGQPGRNDPASGGALPGRCSRRRCRWPEPRRSPGAAHCRRNLRASDHDFLRSEMRSLRCSGCGWNALLGGDQLAEPTAATVQA